MDIKNIRYCRECRVSHHLKIKAVKNSFLENPANARNMNTRSLRVLEDYAHKNVIKSEENLVRLTRMATEVAVEWKPGRVINVSFIGGNKTVKERLIGHAKRWMDFANIVLDFTDRKKAGDIRIAFHDDGSWSEMGTAALTASKNRPTMNFGWLTPRLEDEEYSRVVLHEFGHALGCIHEHERPDNGIPWDKPKVYAYYKETDDWSPEEVDGQVFSYYDRDLIRASKLDRKSIMMYPVPNELTKGNYQVGWNTDLSPADKNFIAKVYPG